MGIALYLCVLVYLSTNSVVTGDTYSVNILTEQYVNIVDSRFLSFTIDPKFLFTSSEKFNSKECVCMASSLTPAYLRIAGPSTAHIGFHNTTISINDVNFSVEEEDQDIAVLDADTPQKAPTKTGSLTVTHREWRKFIHWAKSTGFDLVFALNNQERNSAGMWDPNTALNILSVAEKAKIGEIFWELGYECINQSIEEYLNDLETLRVIIETFPPGRTGDWKVVGGDVTKCLQADSKSDFKDYIMLSNDMLDALLLNGNSSSRELEHMSELNRMRLLRMLSHSKTPLWLTEPTHKRYNQLERAADWLASLGYAAKNGFSVHYRELEEEEMYEPTLSFYMALLFKNLVGERVLDLEMEPKQAIIFGHCTSLRQKPVSGAVTLFGVNMDEEPARFSLKLPKREGGGDVMQFILGYDQSGNIIVNGRAMYYEGDIKPVVKHVRPFKTLLITLPAKSFGFWVLANTNIEACINVGDGNKTVTTQTSTETIKVKRSVDDNDFQDYTHTPNLSNNVEDTDAIMIGNIDLRRHFADINSDLQKMLRTFKNVGGRFKRQNGNQNFDKLKQRFQQLKSKISNYGSSIDFNPRSLINNVLQRARHGVDILKNKGTREVKRFLNKNRVNKRHSRNFKFIKKPVSYLDTNRFERVSKKRANLKNIPKRVIAVKKVNRNRSKNEIVEHNFKSGPKFNDIPKKMNIIEKDSNKQKSIDNEIINDETVLSKTNNRKRRYVSSEAVDLLSTNDLFTEKKNYWNVLKNMHEDTNDFSNEIDDEENNGSLEGIIFKTELSDDAATIKVKDSGKGLIHSTMHNLVNVLEDLNRNLNRVWGALTTLD